MPRTHDNELKLTAEPDGLHVLPRLFAVGNEDDTLFGVSLNPFTAQLIEQVGTAFLCLAKRRGR